MDPREQNLPKWAQELITDLRKRLQGQQEAVAKELATLRPKVTLLERRTAALEELLTCAANGGHRTAKEIVSVLESYSLTLTPDE